MQILQLNVFDSKLCGSHVGYADVVSEDIAKMILTGYL